MLVLSTALIGLLAGLALDALVVRLAVAPDDPDDGGPQPETAEPVAPAANGAESGSLVLPVDTSTNDWTRRLLIMAATSGLFIIAAGRFDETGNLAIVFAYISVLVVCAATDALVFRVPNVVTYPAIVGAIVIGAAMPDANIWEVLAGGALAGGVLFLPAVLTGGVGMGMGDVKLAAFVGLALGFTNATPALIFMALGGGGAAAFLLLTGLRKKGEPIPYAPYISAGALAAMLWQGTAFVDLI